MAITDNLIYYWPMEGDVGDYILTKFDTQEYKALTVRNEQLGSSYKNNGKIYNRIQFLGGIGGYDTAGPNPSFYQGMTLTTSNIFLTKTTNTITCSFWFRLEYSLDLKQGLMGVEDVWKLIYNPVLPGLQFSVKNTTTSLYNTIDVEFTNGPVLDTWYMCAIRWNGSGQVMQVSLYDADETLINTSETVSGYGTSASSGFELFHIGSTTDDILGYLNLAGSICNLAFWDRVLSNAELDSLYNTGDGLVINTHSVIPILTDVKSHWVLTNSGSGSKVDEIGSNDLTNVDVTDDVFPGSCLGNGISGYETKSPTTGIMNDTSIGTVSWTNLNNVTTSNNVYSVAGLFANGSANGSYYLKCRDFAFAIPTGATIDGIKVEVQKFDTLIYDNAVRIMKGDVIGSTDKSSPDPWPASSTYISYGGENDLWGESWSPSDINSSGFGFAISAKTESAPEDAYIDHIRITVYYTEYVSGEGDSTGFVYLDGASDTDIQLSPGDEDFGFSCWFNVTSLPVGNSQIIAGKWATKYFWYKNIEYFNHLTATTNNDEWVLWISREIGDFYNIHFTMYGLENGDTSKGCIRTISHYYSPSPADISSFLGNNFISITGYKEVVSDTNPDIQSYTCVMRINGDIKVSRTDMFGSVASNTSVDFIDPAGNADFEIGSIDPVPFDDISGYDVEVCNFYGIINKATFWKRKLTDVDHATLYNYQGSLPLIDSSPCPLFIHGIDDLSGNIVLYTHGTNEPTATITLFMPGQFTSGIMPLFVHGNTTQVDSIDLYLYGNTESTNSMTLFLDASPVIEGVPPYIFPLFIKVDDWITGNNDSIPLYMFATTEDGVYDNMSLFLEVGESFSTYTNEMNLFMLVPTTGSLNSNMFPLYINVESNASSSITLYVQNDYTSGNMPLYTKGKGFGTERRFGSNGWYPVKNQMNLFINRPDEVAGMTLFLQASDGVGTRTAPLYTFGAYASNENIDLVIPNVTDDINKTMKLFVFGF